MGCDLILNYGLSGGVSGIGRGEITLPDRFLEHDFDLQVLGYKPCEKPSQPSYIYNASQELLSLAKEIIPTAKCGTAVTGDRFICDDAVRIELANTFNAMSCDMETAAIAYVCEYCDIPFLAIRRVSDDAGNDAKDAYRSMNTADETVLYSYVEELIKAIIQVAKGILFFIIIQTGQGTKKDRGRFCVLYVLKLNGGYNGFFGIGSRGLI